MARPLYESARNLQDERAATTIIQQWGRCTLTKLSVHEHIDFRAFRDNQPVALIEFKRRHNNRCQYPTYMIAKQKWDNGIRMSKVEGIPFVLVIKWVDGYHFLQVNDNTPHTLAQGGRYDRGDKLDIEQMVYIDTNLFKFIAP